MNLEPTAMSSCGLKRVRPGPARSQKSLPDICLTTVGMLLTFEIRSPRTPIHETECPVISFNCKKGRPSSPPNRLKWFSAMRPLLWGLPQKIATGQPHISTAIEWHSWISLLVLHAAFNVSDQATSKWRRINNVMDFSRVLGEVTSYHSLTGKQIGWCKPAINS